MAPHEVGERDGGTATDSRGTMHKDTSPIINGVLNVLISGGEVLHQVLIFIVVNLDLLVGELDREVAL